MYVKGSGDDVKREEAPRPENATIVTYPDEFAQVEIRELAKAAGYTVKTLVTQRRLLRSEYGVGVGKAGELAEMVKQNGSRTIIIDEKLTSSQANNLSKIAHAEVVDRERLILNIFAKRAMTTEAKLQVQLAELLYELPRARDIVRYSVNGERAGFSGMGETAVDVKFRALRKQMATIKQKLAQAESNRKIHRVERRKLNMPFVALAGYTSSGKTTLFNKLTSESKEESPSLFTTLTTTTRGATFEPGRKVLLSDTVGFISRLPTYMVESFKSTLEELGYADLVLLLIDVSESAESIRIKLRSCLDILGQLKVDEKKVLLVFNKIDLLKEEGQESIEQISRFLPNFSSVRISASRGDGLDLLRSRILEQTYPPSLKN